jgi:hypothetical protein
MVYNGGVSIDVPERVFSVLDTKLLNVFLMRVHCILAADNPVVKVCPVDQNFQSI